MNSFGAIWVTYATGVKRLLTGFLDEQAAKAWGRDHLDRNANIARWTAFTGCRR